MEDAAGRPCPASLPHGTPRQQGIFQRIPSEGHHGGSLTPSASGRSEMEQIGPSLTPESAFPRLRNKPVETKRLADNLSHLTPIAIDASRFAV